MKEKEKPVPKQPGIYKVFNVLDNGNLVKTSSYRVRWREKHGGKWTTRCHTFRDFDEARNFRNKPKEVREVEKQDLIARQSTFEKLFERFMNHKTNECHLAVSTIEQYWKLKKHFQMFFDLRMENITSKVVDAWCNLLNDPAYLNLQQESRLNYQKEYTLLSTLLRYYKEYENEAFAVPLLNRHRKRLCTRARNSGVEIKYLSENQLRKFISEIFSVGKLFQEIAIVQSQTGMRIGEVLALEKKHVSFERNALEVRQHLYFERKANGRTLVILGTKGGPSRVIPLSDSCHNVLLTRFSESKSERVFELKGEWLSYRQIQHAYDITFKKLGYEHSGTHTLRHTFAVAFLDRTKDIHALQLLLGHSDLKTTQVYAKYTNTAVLRAFEVFNEGQRVLAEITPQTVNMGGFDSAFDSESKLRIVSRRMESEIA